MRIAKKGNIIKFTSGDPYGSKDFLRRLKNLGTRELIFADPSDRILGIGFSVVEAEKVDRGQWGANIFGRSIEAVRDDPKTNRRKRPAQKKKSS